MRCPGEDNQIYIKHDQWIKQNYKEDEGIRTFGLIVLGTNGLKALANGQKKKAIGYTCDGQPSHWILTRFNTFFYCKYYRWIYIPPLKNRGLTRFAQKGK